MVICLHRTVDSYSYDMTSKERGERQGMLASYGQIQLYENTVGRKRTLGMYSVFVNMT